MTTHRFPFNKRMKLRLCMVNNIFGINMIGFDLLIMISYNKVEYVCSFEGNKSLLKDMKEIGL